MFKKLIIDKEMKKEYGNKEILFFENYLVYAAHRKIVGMNTKEFELTHTVITPSKDVFIKCYYCGSIRRLSLKTLKITTSTKWFPEIVTCQRNKCKNRKRADINRYRAKVGESPATGHVVTEKQKKKRLKTLNANFPGDKPWSMKRKGKSFVDQFGKRRAKKYRGQISKYRTEFQSGENEPHLGKPHSEETKKSCL